MCVCLANTVTTSLSVCRWTMLTTLVMMPGPRKSLRDLWDSQYQLLQLVLSFTSHGSVLLYICSYRDNWTAALYHVCVVFKKPVVKLLWHHYRAVLEPIFFSFFLFFLCAFCAFYSPCDGLCTVLWSVYCFMVCVMVCVLGTKKYSIIRGMVWGSIRRPQRLRGVLF